MTAHDGLAFVRTVLIVVGVLAGVAGFVFLLLQVGRNRRRPADGRLDDWWSELAGTEWPAVPRWASARFLKTVKWIVRDFFEEADRTNVFGALFVGLVFVLLPAAAIVNAASGGSPFLALYYLMVLVALAVLNFVGEDGCLAVVNGGAALFLGGSVFLFVPAYVLRSFTDRVLNDAIGHAVLESIAVVPLCYVVAYSTMLFYRGFLPVPARMAAAINGFLAALPVTFVLTFLALQAGAIAIEEVAPAKTWPLLIASMVFASAALPVTLAIMGAALATRCRGGLVAGIAASLAAAAVLSCAALALGHFHGDESITAARALNGLFGLDAAGGRVFLGPDFWVMHLSFLPILALVGGVVTAWLAKTVVAVSRRFGGAGVETRHPLALSGFLCIVWAGIMVALALSIG